MAAAESQKTLLDFCREQNIPFNDTDKVLYKLQQSKDNYQIYKVLFDQLTCNSKPEVAAQGMITNQIQHKPVKLKSGEIHMGWPSRQETP